MNLAGYGKKQPIRILLVEDSPTDALLTTKALKQGKLVNEVIHVSDGVEAMEYLRQGDSSMKPDLILLDLNLPRKSGLEVLEEVKTDPQLKTIPVVVLTSSHEPEDIEGAYKRFANTYIVKPVTFKSFIEVVQRIESFWFSAVTLPRAAA